MEYTAEQYLERIENKRLNSTPLYSREEIIDFAEKYAKQLSKHCCKSDSEHLFAVLRYAMPEQFTDVALINIVKGFEEQSK